MKEFPQALQKAIDSVPDGLPLFLNILTGAGHLYNSGYGVEEHSLVDQGLTGCALIYAPVMMYDEETKEYDGYLDFMFEVRMNILLTMQQAAEECGVNYRTIQRWRDEKKIMVVTINGKQFLPSEMVKDYAARKGHLPGRLCRR